MATAGKCLFVVLAALIIGGVIAGCQSTHEQMLAAGYPPAYADGYAAGCDSGQHAAGAGGTFTKNVARYQSDKVYHDGWDDGLNQCQSRATASASSLQRSEDRWDLMWRDRDRDWDHHTDQMKAKALRGN